MTAIVTAVCSSPGHTFSKPVREAITLVAGLGVAGDAHQGATVRHRSRVRADPGQPNLRQVHLIHGELHDALQQAGFNVAEGTLGENITTRGIDLLDLPRDSLLYLGGQAIVRITGLRNPCAQLDRYQRGLMAAVLSATPPAGWCARPASWRWWRPAATCAPATRSKSSCRRRRIIGSIASMVRGTGTGAPSRADCEGM